MDKPKISAIIPSYKEEKRIEKVLIGLKKSMVDEIIVVDDGSNDNTYGIVKKHNGRYIENNRNYGKGFSMDRGVKNTDSEIILFCDADLKDFSYEMFNRLLEPVLYGECEMCIADRRNRKNKFLVWSGQRALKRELWERMPKFYKRGFRVELGLNFFCNNIKYLPIKYTQHLKETKHGLVNGIYRRVFMYYQIFTAYLAYLYFK